MKPKLLITPTVVSLLALVCTQSALLAQNGAIQLTLKGGWTSASEPVRKLQVVGSYAYLVVGETGLQVLDVSSPTNPVPLDRCDAAHRINGFHVAGHHAYLATGNTTPVTNDPGVLEVLDVTQPTSLVFLSKIETRGRANGVHVAGDYAYLAEDTWWTGSNLVGGLAIFCVTNPANPILTGRYDASGPVNDIKVVDGYAYLAGGDAALVILNVRDVHSPVWVGAFRTNGAPGQVFSGYAVEVKDRYANVWTSAGFFILDVQEPSCPVRVSEVLPRRSFVEGAEVISAVHAANHYAFVTIRATDEYGVPEVVDMIVCDISNPADWIRLGGFDQPALVDLQLAGGHAYMAVAAGLLVYEITELPYFRSIVRTADKIILSWNDLPGLRLQCTPSLTNPDWTDVPGSVGTNQMQLPLGAGHQFFRLVQPATP